MKFLFWIIFVSALLALAVLGYTYARTKRYLNSQTNKQIEAWQNMKKALSK